MKRAITPKQLLSPQSITRLLGAEFHLMRDAGVLRRFYVSSLLVLLIVLLTLISVWYAIDLLFHTLPVEIALSAFFSLLFACIYIFLINTFAKATRISKSLLNASNLIRIGFVIFMAFLVAQPLLILLFDRKLEPAVEAYRESLLTAHLARIETINRAEIEKAQKRRQQLAVQQQQFGTRYYDQEIERLDRTIFSLQTKTQRMRQEAVITIQRNSFFLFRISAINARYPVAWIISSFIIALFVAPGYIIYSISSSHDYYQLKKEQERRLVAAAYEDFLQHYPIRTEGLARIFSRYEDPPFNTIRKKDPEPASMAAFISKYLRT